MKRGTLKADRRVGLCTRGGRGHRGVWDFRELSLLEYETDRYDFLAPMDTPL